MKHVVAFLIILTCAITLGNAQELNPSPEAQELAYEVTQLLGVRDLVLSGASVTVDDWIESDPALAPYRCAMIAWSESGITLGEYIPPIARILLDTFSEQELENLKVFLETPTGRKVLVQLPLLLERGRTLGTLLMEQHRLDVGNHLRSRPRDASYELPGDEQ